MANYNSLKNAALIAPTTALDLGSDSKRYGNVFLSGNINLSGTTLSSTNVITPKISTIGYVGNDTAADIAGGQTITLTGTGFSAGATILINGEPVSLVTFVSSTTLTFTSPAMSAGGYVIYVINPDGGTALSVPGIQYSGVPNWSTAAGSLGQINESTSINIALSATGDAPITYSVSSGALPTGISLNSSTGFVSGTAPTVENPTTYNFAIRASDGQSQDTIRNFSLTITPSFPPPTIEYLAVAGGGGGAYYGGGGGAGGYLTATNFSVPTGVPIAVTVGAGGAAGTYAGTASGTNGINSSLLGGDLATVAVTALMLVNAAPTSIYPSSYTFTSASADFNFSVQISGTRPGDAGYLGIGLKNVTADTLTYAVEYADYPEYGPSLARKVINYAYSNWATSTPFRLRATKTGNSIVFSFLDTNDVVQMSETVALTSSVNYKIFLYYNRASTVDTQIATIITDTANMYTTTAYPISAIAYGGGGGSNGGTGSYGGSGGGGYINGNPGGAAVPGQGNPGGSGVSGNGDYSGAGGGAGSAGLSGNVGAATGGAGRSSSITGTSITYAGGGGGGGWIGSGVGGSGGGGNAGLNGTSGTTNLGGGGGGSKANAQGALYGGAGGSGVVVIRYSDEYTAASTTGSPTVTVTGGYRIYKFTSSGSITF